MCHYSMLNALTYPMNNKNNEMKLKILHVISLSSIVILDVLLQCSVWVRVGWWRLLEELLSYSNRFIFLIPANKNTPQCDTFYNSARHTDTS